MAAMRTAILSLLLAGGLTTTAQAQTCYQWPVVDVYDGDTLTAEVVPNVYSRVRILGLDAPEIKGKCQAEIDLAKASRDRLADLVRHGAQFCPADKAGLRVPPWDKRTYAWVSVLGKDVARSLIDEGLARFYLGGKREGWCE